MVLMCGRSGEAFSSGEVKAVNHQVNAIATERRTPAIVFKYGSGSFDRVEATGGESEGPVPMRRGITVGMMHRAMRLQRQTWGRGGFTVDFRREFVGVLKGCRTTQTHFFGKKELNSSNVKYQYFNEKKRQKKFTTGAT
jgi:hypothetical protein